MSRYIIKLIVAAYIGIFAYLSYGIFGSYNDEALWLSIWIVTQSAVILYLALHNWNDDKEKIVCPAYFIIFGAGCVVSFLFYFATKGLMLYDTAYYFFFLFLCIVEVVLDVLVFDPNKYREPKTKMIKGKEIEVILPYFDTSNKYFDYSFFEHTDSESNTIVNVDVSKLDDFISRTQRMLELPQPLKEYFNGDFKKDVSKLKKNKNIVVLKNNFKKFVYINKNETGEKLLMTFIH